jgi:acyl dehydratase
VWDDVVGRRSTPVTNWIERGAVKRFAQAIGDLNPLYYDDNAARASTHGRLVAPPTFPVTLDYGVVDGLNVPAAGLIHGSQSFSFQRPLFVGEQVECTLSLGKTFTKTGSRGLLTFLELHRSGREPGGPEIFSSVTTLIVTEVVLQGLRQ